MLLSASEVMKTMPFIATMRLTASVDSTCLASDARRRSLTAGE
jgi:hypothetical protein